MEARILAGWQSRLWVMLASPALSVGCWDDLVAPVCWDG